MPRGKFADDEFKELKVKLARTVSHFNALQKENHCHNRPSKTKDLELLTGQVILQQLRLLFEDLRKIKGEIENNFFNTVHGDIGGVNGARHKLERVKEEYLKLLFDVEEGRRAIGVLRNNMNCISEVSSGKLSKEYNSPDENGVTWIREKSKSEEEIRHPCSPSEKSTYVYHCNTAVGGRGKNVGKAKGKKEASPPPKEEGDVPEELDQYLSYIFKIECENNSLREQINQLQSELCKVTSNFGEIHSSLGLASSENKARQMELEKLNNEVKELRDRICVADRTVQNLTEENSRLKKGPKVVQEEPQRDSYNPAGSKSQKTEMRRLQTELTSALKKNETYQVELKEAVEIVRKLTTQLESKEKEIDNLHTIKFSLEKKAQERSSKDSESAKSSKSQEVILAQKLLEKSYQIEALIAENGELKRRVENMSDDVSSLEKKKEFIWKKKDEMAKQIQSLLTENADLSKSLDDKLHEISTTRALLTRIENSLKSEQRGHSTTRSELTKVKKELAAFMKKMTSDKAEKDVAQDKATALLQEVETIEKKFKDMEEKKNQTDKEAQLLKEKLDELKSAYEKKFHEQNTLMKLNEGRFEQMESKMAEVAKENENLKKQVNDLKRINNSLAEECVKTGQDHFKLKYEKIDLVKNEERLELTIKNLKCEIEELKNFKAVQSSEIRDLDNRLGQLKEEKMTIESQVKTYERRVASLIEENKQLTLELQDQEHAKEELKKEIDDTKRNLRGVISENFNIRLKLRENTSDNTKSEPLSDYSTDTTADTSTVIHKGANLTILNDFHGQFDSSDYRQFPDSPSPTIKKSSTAVTETPARTGILKWPQCSTAPANVGGHLNYSVYNVEFDIQPQAERHRHRNSSYSAIPDISSDDLQNIYFNTVCENKSCNKLTQ